MLGGRRCRLHVRPWAAADPPQATTEVDPAGRMKLQAPPRLCWKRVAPAAACGGEMSQRRCISCAGNSGKQGVCSEQSGNDLPASCEVSMGCAQGWGVGGQQP